MDNKEGIQQLKRRITDTLLPLIGKKCVLYDTPFYKNIGDVLIWQGELSFLEDNNIEILDYADYHTYRKKELSEDVTILFQGGGNIGECENYLVVDSDVTFTKDINFFENGNPIFYYRDDYHHPPFFDVMNKIIDIKRFYETSFVCDFMVFNRKVMSDLKKHIEEHTGENWIDAIIHRIDYSLSPFSEFETYGTFYEGEMIIRKVEYKQLDYLETDLDKQEKNNPNFRAVVMPRYLRK